MFVLRQMPVWNDVSLKPAWVRNMEIPSEYRFGPVTNPFAVGWLVLRGCRTVVMDDKRVTLEPGDLVFFHPHIRYDLPPEPVGGDVFHSYPIGCEMTVGGIEWTSFYRVPAMTRLSEEEFAELASAWKRMIGRFDLLARSESNRRPWPVCLEYLGLQAACFSWLEGIMGALSQRWTDPPDMLDGRIAAACDYIRQHAGGRITLDALARHVYLSPSHLSHLFVRALGCPPMEYVRRYRIRQAKQLLIDSSGSLGSIAERLGYESQSHFSRAFRLSVGVSPLKYRQSWRGN